MQQSIMSIMDKVLQNKSTTNNEKMNKVFGIVLSADKSLEKLHKEEGQKAVVSINVARDLVMLSMIMWLLHRGDNPAECEEYKHIMAMQESACTIDKALN